MPAVTTTFPPSALSNSIDCGVYLTNLLDSPFFSHEINIKTNPIIINNKRFIILIIRGYIINNFYILIVLKI